MGSYATWRAAILVFTYPQNILDPTLRKYQTPGFQQLVSTIQNNPSLTTDQACHAACTYANYYRDVCSMNIEASVQANTILNVDQGCSCGTPDQQASLLYMMGRGGATNVVYWSAWNSQDTSGYAQTFWDWVPGLVATPTVNLIGAQAYRTPSGNHYICLFARIKLPGAQGLALTRYDLNAQQWDASYISLSLPEQSANFDAILLSQGPNEPAPQLRIKAASGSIYQSALNDDATDWADGNWVPLTWSPWYRIDSSFAAFPTPASPWPPLVTLGVVNRGPNHLDVFVVGSDAGVYEASWDLNTNNAQWGPFQGAPGIPGWFRTRLSQRFPAIPTALTCSLRVITAESAQIDGKTVGSGGR
jgi:hypothetical protein